MNSKIAGTLALAFCLSGCGGISYLLQAGQGQLALMNHARPIQEVLKDERISSRIKNLLVEISPIKKFGESHGLKPTHNYTDYVKLDRPAAVWVVSASEPLRFEAKKWGFPIVGSFPYLGWFDREQAKKYSEQLKNEGWDVDLRGARAFSTLGWFRDAVLSTMIPEGDEALGELVNVVLHESVHATVYVNGQSYFNESLASFIADRLTSEYLQSSKGINSAETQAYEDSVRLSEKNTKILAAAYQQLSQIYDSDRTREQKQAEKNRIYLKLKDELKFKRDLNNATLIQYKTYNMGEADFETLLRACDHDWKRFLEVTKHLKLDSFSHSQQESLHGVLDSAIHSHCN